MLLLHRAAGQKESLARGPQADHSLGDRQQQSVSNRQREPSWGHGTQKPVECMRRSIVNNSRLGQLVYDPARARA
jgi:hypothetical protein